MFKVVFFLFQQICFLAPTAVVIQESTSTVCDADKHDPYTMDQGLHT